ncbi:hypothetical protein HDR58_06160, partial [bacterium]|nr:hypothetical protein [bacterium]
MRGKGYIGRILAGMMAAVLMLTSVPFTVYATEAVSSAETASEQEENMREEEAAQEDEEKDKSEGESKENGDDSESGEEQIGEWNGESDQEEDEKDGEKSDNGEKEDDHDTDDTEEEPGDQDISEEMVSENSAEKTEDVLRTDLQSSLSVKGRNSVGNMLAEALSDKAEEQLESNGYNVFSVEMKGQTATVSFETLQDAVLTVAIYDETGRKLLASGSQEVSVEDRIAEVEIVETVPQFFYVRGFLTDKETLQPLCPLYDSPMYTKDMQEFLTKTTDDFEEERVLNLDDDKTNNFAVYSEKAVIIPYKTDVNILMSADDENYIYVIGNADESVVSLQAGDIFVYEYTEGVTLIVKVASIKIDDATVTIQGEELSMEEVFDYVKINSKEGLGSAEIDASNLEDGVFYEGIVPYSSEGIETYKWGEIDKEWDKEAATSFKFKDKVLGDSMKFSGSLELKLKSSLKVYLSRDYAYLELKFEYSLKLEGNLSAEKKGENAFQIPLGSIRIDFIPLVYVKLTPNFVIEAEEKAGWSGTLKGVIGLAASSDEGVRSLTSMPKFESKWKAEVSVFLGISFKPEIGIISEKIAAASVEAVAGVEVKAKYSSKTPSTSKIHECIACIDGDINGKRECKFKIKLGNKDKWSWEVKVGDSIHISDFYYSQDFDEFDLGKCPHYLYKIEMTVTDQDGTAIQGAQITTQDGFYVNKNEAGQTISSAGEAVWTEAA